MNLSIELQNHNTVKILLYLKYERKTFLSGLCLSKENYSTLLTTYNNFLHTKDIIYFSKLTYYKRKYSYLLGRYCAKEAISILYNDINLSSVHIYHGIFQQPIVHCPELSNIQVSISHSNSLGSAIAFAEPCPMGIDVEVICDSKIHLLQDQLTNLEKLQLGIDFHNATQLILRWSVKEALSKALRCGLTIPFHLLEINNILQEENFITSFFTHFPQYKAASFIIDNAVCSIVYPIKMKLDLKLL